MRIYIFSTLALKNLKTRFKIYGVMKMKQNKNICKFTNTEIRQSLTTYNFVFEKIAQNTDSFRIPEHHTVYLVTEGKGRLLTENDQRDLCQGKIFYTFQRVPFQIENTDRLQYMYISFDGDRCEELFARFGISPANCVFEGHEALCAFWENAIIKAGEKNLDLISESVLLYTLGEMAPSRENGESYLIADILKYMEENFSDSELNLKTVSEHFGYNSKYVSRIFKNSRGVTFSAHLTNIRIQHAVFLMEQNVTSVKNIALLSGYKDPLYFSNVFKAKIGSSPKDFLAKKQPK